MVEDTLPHEYPENTAVSMGTVGNVKPNVGLRYKKIPMKLDIETLDLLLAYAYDVDNQYITRSALNNLLTWVSLCNVNLYKNNQSLRSRVDLLALLLEARLHMGFDNRKIMMNYALDKCDNKNLIREEIIPEFNKIKLNTRMTQYLNSYVVDRLIHAFIFSYKDELFQVFEDLESHNYTTLRDITQKFKEIITNLLFDIRNAENFAEDTMTLDLSEGSFDSIVKQIVKKLKDPSNKLIAGIQALNIMLNGGFEQARSYLFFGMTGAGKSVLLINLMIFLKKCNRFKTKDPSKRPAVLYISQENTVAETVERIFNMEVTGNNIRDYTPAEVVKLLRTKGELTLNTEDDIDIIIKYYDDKTISTIDIYSIISDIEDTGREVIALLHDYIERIKSSKNHAELRFELAEVANDYSVLAKRLSIPVIGAGQFNRKAADTIETGADGNKYDIGKLLGKSFISEAFAILKNIDSAIAINRETDDEGNDYMTFKDMKQRSSRGKKHKFSDYFAHPFDPQNGIKLVQDIHEEEPVSRTSLDEVREGNEIVGRNKPKKREIKELPIQKKKFDQNNEVITNDQIKDFKFLGDIINERKAIKEKLDKRVEKVNEEEKLDAIFRTYNSDDKYVRNERGLISVTINTEFFSKKTEWQEF
jgi:replicative DNA helicase